MSHNDYLSNYKGNYQSFPQLDTLKKLWHHSYWDGALSGVCEVNGDKCWFECIEEWLDNHSFPEDDDNFEPPWYRRFLVHKLTNEQFLAVKARNDKFRQMVGNHTNYDESGKRSSFQYNDTITPETVNRFYEESKSDVFPDISPVSDKDIVGWYESFLWLLC